MRRFLLFLVLMLVFLVISASFYFRNIAAEGVISSSQTEVSTKLDKLLDNQKEILQRLEDLKKDIRTRCNN